MIALNEYEHARKLIEKGMIDYKPSKTLELLARYYKQCEKLKDKEIYEKLNAFMERSFKDYIQCKWYGAIFKQIRKADKVPITKIDFVPVTAKELATISSIKNIQQERLAFALLCVAKLYNMKNENNNNWVNYKFSEVFKMARVMITNRNQCLMLNELKELGLVDFSKRIDKINIQVNYIDDTEPVVLKISDFRELGYEYQLWKGKKYIRCTECQRLFKPKCNRSKYCNECKLVVRQKQETDRQSRYRQRKNSSDTALS